VLRTTESCMTQHMVFVIDSTRHIFNFDEKGSSYGLKPSQYHWALKKDGDAKKEADWQAIWPWEKGDFEKKGMKVSVGAKPWEM